MTVYPIVEGHGDTEAVPLLLRRMFHEVAGCPQIVVGRSIRRTRPEFRTETGTQQAVKIARVQDDCSAIVLLFDSDDDCPKEMAQRVAGWARAAARGVPCEVVMPCREYESWFLASLESLRGVCSVSDEATSLDEPEAPRNAKGELEARMAVGASYSPSIHQPKLTARLDPARAYQHSRSFRRLTKAVGDVAAALGQRPAVWPPEGWAS